MYDVVLQVTHTLPFSFPKVSEDILLKKLGVLGLSWLLDSLVLISVHMAPVFQIIEC